MAVSNYMLPPLPAIEIHNAQAAEKWKRINWTWKSYSMATGLSELSEEVKVAMLLTVIGEEACEVLFTLTEWEHNGDDKKIKPVLDKLDWYLELRKNIAFERYRFNRGS